VNIQSDAMPASPLDSRRVAPATLEPTRPFYWSIRREFWENRFLYIAPLGAAAVCIFGFLIGAIHLPARMRSALALDPLQQHAALMKPYEVTAGMIMVVAMIVGVFYSLDALHGERRDRSILFWKSLPVSDLTTVLAKAAVSIVLLQLLAFALTIATQWIMLLLSSAVLLGSGQNVAALWSQLSFFRMSMLLLYHLLTVHGLWYAPFYAYFLLVSAWARRATFLWAALPPLAIGVVEKIAFNTAYFAEFIGNRLRGGPEADAMGKFPIDPMTHLTPGQFLISPGLWIGLAIAAIFLFAAARLRRYRGPI
jgi:ABC-2 type transport system permease protein